MANQPGESFCLVFLCVQELAEPLSVFVCIAPQDVDLLLVDSRPAVRVLTDRRRRSLRFLRAGRLAGAPVCLRGPPRQ